MIFQFFLYLYAFKMNFSECGCFMINNFNMRSGERWWCMLQNSRNATKKIPWNQQTTLHWTCVQPISQQHENWLRKRKHSKPSYFLLSSLWRNITNTGSIPFPLSETGFGSVFDLTVKRTKISFGLRGCLVSVVGKQEACCSTSCASLRLAGKKKKPSLWWSWRKPLETMLCGYPTLLRSSCRSWVFSCMASQASRDLLSTARYPEMWRTVTSHWNASITLSCFPRETMTLWDDDNASVHP